MFNERFTQIVAFKESTEAETKESPAYERTTKKQVLNRLQDIHKFFSFLLFFLSFFRCSFKLTQRAKQSSSHAHITYYKVPPRCLVIASFALFLSEI